MKVVYRYKTETKEFECTECRIYGNIAAMNGVKNTDAKTVRIPLFDVIQMDTY